MSFRFQAILFLLVAIVSVSVSRLFVPRTSELSVRSPAEARAAAGIASPTGAYERATGAGNAGLEERFPERRWDVLDPAVAAQAATVQSIDSPFSFLNFHTYALWPMASLTKLLTATVALEHLDPDAKLTVSERAVATEGVAGDLMAGDTYPVRDLLKLMLLSSSNDAAAVFEEYPVPGDSFVGLMSRKLAELGMTQTAVFDASGLSERNVSSASDLLKLTRFIAMSHPEIFEWTRLQSFIAQPSGRAESATIRNINPFSASQDFLGGKTGTSPLAGENLLAVFSLANERVAVILLGAKDRVALTNGLLDWVKNAYTFSN